MHMLPLVSVFVVTYNQEEFIGSAIQSVLDQDYENLEIVIGDDCSTDNTWLIVQDYQRRYPEKIRAFRNSRNLGITGNSNEVLKRCAGKYVAHMGGDDLFLPGKISAQVSVMESDPNIVLCYHDVEMFNSDDNRTLRYSNSGMFSAPPIAGRAGRIAKVLTKRNFMAALSVMVRRDAIPTSGYDQRIQVASDWMMWIDVVAGSLPDKRVEYIPQILARYRRHASNITASSLGWAVDPLVTLAIVEYKYPFLMAATDKGRTRLRYSKAAALILDGRTHDGRQHLLHILRTGRVSWKWFFWLSASFIPQLLKFIRERRR